MKNPSDILSFLNKSEAIFRNLFHSEILKFLPQKAFQNGGGTQKSERSRPPSPKAMAGQAGSMDGVVFILRFAYTAALPP